MNEFPRFMKNPANAIASHQQSVGVEGYIFDGADGSQMAFWTCERDGASSEHVHDHDEYFIVVQGVYTLIMEGKAMPIAAGQEYFIPRGIPHAGKYVAGTRTIHAFGGKRALRENEA